MGKKASKLRIHYDEPMMSLYVLSACQLSCHECIMSHLMAKDAYYQMSIQEIKDMLHYTEASGYKFHYRLTGGEPLMWKNLKEGLKLLHASPSCLSLSIISNAVDVTPIDDELMAMITVMRVSKYLYNQDKVEYLLEKYPDKVFTTDKEVFSKNPKEPVANYLPVQCMNAEVMFYNNRVYACPHSESIAIGANVTDVKLYHELGMNYLDGLRDLRHGQEEKICSRCISNKTVRNEVERVLNVSGKGAKSDRLIKHQKRWNIKYAREMAHNARVQIKQLISGMSGGAK
ncbi:MAG: 4Fe-4S cluster-binding domain-containing protein [Proteobacteria bacterium]|nr:4Fe-4S cluster-binding domain-containing protein [Pseudomonadota bacterium]